MKKYVFFLIILTLCLILPLKTEVKAEVVAPALQYLREDYPSAFLKSDDYSIKLNTTRRYKLRCESDIMAIAIGDKDNLKAKENPEFAEEKMLYELNSPRDVVIKTRHEAYTYMQIYTVDSETPVTVLLSINKKNVVPNLITFGNCTMFEEIN